MDEEVTRLPTYSVARKHIKSSWPSKFVEEKIIIRFGLAIDKVNT